MQVDKFKHDSDGKLKNGVYKEYFKDGTLSCEGKYRRGERVGEWRTYEASGKVIKATRHNPR